MARIGLVVAVLSAAAAVWLGLEVRSLRAALETQRQEVVELRAGGTSLARTPVSGEPQPTATVGAAPVEPSPSDAEGGVSPALTARPPTPGTVEEKLAALERRLEEQGKRLTALRDTRSEVQSVGGVTWMHDADSAAKTLKLDDGQKAEVERVLEDMKRDVEDLRSRPNDDGLTWKEAAKVKFEGSADGAFLAFSGNTEKLDSFKKSKIPGSSETYAEADRRIRARAKDSMRRLLSPEQQKTFDEAHTEGLFGGGAFDSFAIAIGGIDEVVGDK